MLLNLLRNLKRTWSRQPDLNRRPTHYECVSSVFFKHLKFLQIAPFGSHFHSLLTSFIFNDHSSKTIKLNNRRHLMAPRFGANAAGGLLIGASQQGGKHEGNNE